jgi:c-di-GMP-binding flagellar brake protein YcgR
MRNKKEIGENRREHMRVDSRLHFCISVVEGIDEEAGKYIYGSCFCTLTEDISLGGICIHHGGKLNEGDSVEISTPQKMKRAECLTCEDSYMFTNNLDLLPIFGKVLWIRGSKCGIEFRNLSRRNENVLSKFIWDEHLDGIRDNKKKDVVHKKF